MTTNTAAVRPAQQPIERPSAPLMLFAFLLTGLGTAMLGPLLPLLTRQWQLSDEHSGLLLLAQFSGAFLGGATVSWRLKRGLLTGVAAAAVGIAGFALARGLLTACPALIIAGFGIGHALTAVNILAGQRYTERRASALALLNFFWSLGAMLAPLLAGLLTPHISVPHLLLGFSGLFTLVTLTLFFELQGTMGDMPPQTETTGAGQTGLVPASFVFFAALLFVYGGLETCLSGWLTTYALRYGQKTLILGESTTLLLWMSLTAGRAGSAALLRRVPETLLWRSALALTVLMTAALAVAHSVLALSIVTVVLGSSLSPWFPVTLSLLLSERPRPRQAGIVIAVSGLGAAALPWLMGVVSTRAGSLQRAVIVPFLAAAALLALSLVRRTTGSRAI